MRSFWPSKIFLSTLIFLFQLSVYSDDTLVLVVSKSSPIEALNPLQVRKLYLGFVVRHEGQNIYALTNESDEALTEVFLQNVMGMSRRTYDYRLLALTFHSGRRQPVKFSHKDDLIEAVSNNPLLVTCMWLKDVEDVERLKTLRILWAR